MKFFLEYVLCRKQPSGQKAEKGNVVHKALELLALENLAKKAGDKFMEEPELGKIKVGKSVKELTKLAYDLYTSKSIHKYTKIDFDDCLEWTNKVLDYKDGMCDPRNLDIISAEKSFDIEIKEPWARYHYTLPNNEIWSGYLAIKGNIDLITRIDDDNIEFLDYKTGKRMNWNTMRKKDEADLKKDPQLLLYYLALRTLYPDKNVIVSIYYINDGGVYSVYFDDTDLAKAKELVRKRFEEIKQTQYPRRVRNAFMCKRFCAFRQGDDICEQVHQDIEKHGMNYALDKHNTGLHKINMYGDGGGKQAKDK